MYASSSFPFPFSRKLRRANGLNDETFAGLNPGLIDPTGTYHHQAQVVVEHVIFIRLIWVHPVERFFIRGETYCKNAVALALSYPAPRTQFDTNFFSDDDGDGRRFQARISCR